MQRRYVHNISVHAWLSKMDKTDHLKVTGITDTQLDGRIEEGALWEIAGLLGSYEQYVGTPGFNLNAADKADLKTSADKNGNQHAMKEALTKWFNVTRADKTTYRSLVDILLELRKKSAAEKVCRIGESATS